MRTRHTARLVLDHDFVDARLLLECKLQWKGFRRESVRERDLLDSRCERREYAYQPVAEGNRGGGNVALTNLEICCSGSDVGLPRCAGRVLARSDARYGAVVRQIVHLDDRSARVRIGCGY